MSAFRRWSRRQKDLTEKLKAWFWRTMEIEGEAEIQNAEAQQAASRALVLLTRPPGYAPRGTSLGLAGFASLGIGVPFLTIQSLVPVLPDGLDLWIGSLFPVLAFSNHILGHSHGRTARAPLSAHMLLVTGGVMLLTAFVVGVSIGVACFSPCASAAP